MPPRTTADAPGTLVSAAATSPPVRDSAVATVCPDARSDAMTCRASPSGPAGPRVPPLAAASSPMALPSFVIWNSRAALRSLHLRGLTGPELTGPEVRRHPRRRSHPRSQPQPRTQERGLRLAEDVS